ncbi:MULTISPECIES: DUF6220 domain-containing protein [Kribbella]|jgi:hypothetical protein|uniref:DUF4383 domain-containing protein n=1 Tax=Kribbella pratensis TaxID=2512112 RepID=A0ABY2FCX9_9ACTN|nr:MULTISPECIES: DUF6220 domain-containing protein [Kribbella]TDW88238.1 hypothetical protein EV137_6332 [Kribbella pratensis]TDW88549.1 hypothetical protein EV647_5555 [Kribbella sp. VKM Ac-2566]
MRSVYRALAGLIAILVVVQAMAIALAWFTVIKDVDGGLVFDKNSDANVGHMIHTIVGSGVIPLLAILLLIVSFFAKVDGGVKWALYVFGLVALQFGLAALSFGVSAVGALHGLNAFALLAVAGMAARRAGSQPVTTAAASPASTI